MKFGVTILAIVIGAASAAATASACGFHHAPTSVQSQVPQGQVAASQGSGSQMTTTATTTTGKTTGG